MDEESSLLPKKEYVVYASRWFQLVVYGFINASNAMMWVTFAPITPLIADTFHVSQFAVSTLSMTFMVAAILLMMVCSSALTTPKGVQRAMWAVAVTDALGCWLRWLGYRALVALPHGAFPILFVGQTLGAIAQPVVLAAPALISNAWFPESERVIATTVGSLSNVLGMLWAYAMVPAIARNGRGVGLMLFVQALITSVVFGASVFFRGAPPSPPSASANTEKEGYWDSVRMVFKNRQFLVLFGVFSLFLAGFNSLMTLLSVLVSPYYSDDDAGLWGGVMIAAGLIGAGVAGVIADRTKAFMRIYVVLTVVSTITFWWFTFALRPHQDLQIIICMVIMGLFALAVLPITLEIGVELCFPAPESVSSGLLMMGGQGVSIIVITIMQKGFTPSKDKGYQVSDIFLSSVISLGTLIVLLFLRPVYHRQHFENQLAKRASAKKQWQWWAG